MDDLYNNNDILIMGAGHQGLSMAAHLTYEGETCKVWNRSYSTLKPIVDSKRINLNGAVKADVHAPKMSTDIEEVLSRRIMVTTPSTAHTDIARILAPYLDESFTVVLNPGRTFGAASFAESLKIFGCKRLPVIAETQTIVYTCRRDSNNEVTIFGLKDDVPIAALNQADALTVMNALPSSIREHFVFNSSFLYTSFGNVGMILHCAPMLLNAGWIEHPDTNFEYYYDALSPRICDFIDAMDRERIAVAAATGAEVETTLEWLNRTYKTHGNTIYESLKANASYKGIYAPKSLDHRYITEDVPNGLVPVESAGSILNISTPTITLMIDLASKMLGIDFRAKGRTYETALKYLTPHD